MRVTNSMLVSTLLGDLNNNTEKMQRFQEMLSSGKKINRPSDDPVGLIDALRMRTNLTEIKQYKSNAEEAKSWLESSDIALNEFGNVLQRVRELTVRAANGSLPQESLNAISSEVGELKDQLLQIVNTKYGDRYLFSGTMTRTASYSSGGVYQGNTNGFLYEVGIGAKVPLNVSGSEAFGNVFSVLDNLQDSLSAANIGDISNLRLDEIDSVLNKSLEVRSDLGARINRLDFTISRIDSQNVNMTDLLSKAEDVDMAELIMQLKMQENVYKASLSAGARIVQPTLIDFLR